MQTFLKPLSATDESHYLQVLHSDNLEEAREAKEKLIMHNLRLVAHITKKYQASAEEMEDYISIGIIGLVKAVDTFDASRGRLATYACRCIDNELLMMFRAKKKTSKEVSLFDSVKADKDGNEIYLYNISTKEEDTLSKLEQREAVLFLLDAMQRVLDERERDILERRFGMKGRREQTQHEIGIQYHISRSYDCVIIRRNCV